MMAELPDNNKTPELTPNVGHMIVVVDTARLMAQDALSARVQDARAMVTASPTVEETAPIRLPGARAIAALNKARAEGFVLSPELFATLTGLAKA
jgi:LDH2 family malate/lactate/ureidoglycolate dehydrogenase